MSTEHVVSLEGPSAYPGGKDGTYRASCSCGKYVSGFYAYPGHAQMAAEAHAKTKRALAGGGS